MKNQITLKEDYVIIHSVCRGQQVEILVDYDTYKNLTFYNGTVHATRARSGTMYAYLQWQVQNKRLTTQLHHVVMGLPESGYVVDHINRNGLDNRKENLRIVSEAENHWNTSLEGKTQKGKHSTGHRNISYGFNNHKMCYRVRVLRNGKEKHLGFFDTLEEAIKARNVYLAQEETQ